MIKNEKGITLVTLIAAIVIMLIISSTLIYNANVGASTKRLNNMYSDITILKGKIDIYYSKYGTLPILHKYTKIDNIKELNNNDNENFYIIDIESLENLTLNYGKGYEKEKTDKLSQETDIYVVNEKSHNIYYIKGIKFENKLYHTMPGQYEKVEIPEWSDTYTKNEIYKDIQGDIAVIPKGFQVSLKKGQNKIQDGLVIRNSEDLNEFVWIPVEKVQEGYSIRKWDNFNQQEQYEEYYTSDLQQNEQIVNGITTSVKNNGGYYISRYEIGTTTKRTQITDTITQLKSKASTQEEKIYVYNYISWEKATELADNLYNIEENGVQSRLINARGWDTALKFIQEQEKTYTTEGMNKGWYSNNSSANMLLETGKNIPIQTNSYKNIYDMGGNVWEYVAQREILDITQKQIRGGGYESDPKLNNSTSINKTKQGKHDIGFRIALYL